MLASKGHATFSHEPSGWDGPAALEAVPPNAATLKITSMMWRIALRNRCETVELIVARRSPATTGG
ncbi:MAG TPA: hypothetical protein VFR80_12140 [Pyrinomonadaceae bacterium]|nr:hypothetical protein [Pyrinomonadaceae bacterium]